MQHLEEEGWADEDGSDISSSDDIAARKKASKKKKKKKEKALATSSQPVKSEAKPASSDDEKSKDSPAETKPAESPAVRKRTESQVDADNKPVAEPIAAVPDTTSLSSLSPAILVPSSSTSMGRRKPFQAGDQSETAQTAQEVTTNDDQASKDALPVVEGTSTATDVSGIAAYITTDKAPNITAQETPDVATQEKLLSHHQMLQEDLTASMLDMARALKTSSQAFATSLDSEKELLDRATAGLETNTTSMGAAEKRMGAIRRMTEGRGWWGRMIIYAWLMGLVLIALIIVGFLPKLRF